MQQYGRLLNQFTLGNWVQLSCEVHILKLTKLDLAIDKLSQ